MAGNRRTLQIRVGDPSQTALSKFDLFLRGIIGFEERITGE
jgi:hypothetical protein